jgi:hypothetical protein
MIRALGRNAMVKNLLDHLRAGSSAVVAGGPRMGKSTFLRQIETAADGVFHPVSIDLAAEPHVDLAQRLPDEGGPSSVPPAIFLIDGCEQLLPDPLPFLEQMHRSALRPGTPPAGTVWSGDPHWGEWAMANRPAFNGPTRYYPLIVLPPKEARLFLKRHWSADVPSSELEWVVELSGGHPYLLAQMVEGPKRDFDEFFAKLWKAADSQAERHILAQLIEAATWVPLHELKDETGANAPKTLLDRLAVSGLINRTLVDGAAVVALVSPLFADWARRTGYT